LLLQVVCHATHADIAQEALLMEPHMMFGLMMGLKRFEVSHTVFTI
jgi:hypothetical protein